MPYWRFASMATLGSIVWITGLALIGKAVGHQWPQWKHHLDYVDYAVVAIVVVLLAWFLMRMIRNRRTTGAKAVSAGRWRHGEPALGRALALGVMHGPAELLPISSSGHIELVPWLLGWEGVSRRPGGAQGLRGRAARRHRGGAGGDAARRGDRGRTRGQPRLRRGGRAVAAAAGDRRLRARAADRALPRQARDDRRRPDRRRGGAGLGRPRAAGAELRRGHPDRRPLARRRPGLRAVPGRLAQRRDADRGAAAALHARRRRAALTARGAAGDRRRDLPEVPAPVAARTARGLRPGVRGRRGRLVRLDARLDAADRAGRARPLAAPFAAYRVALGSLAIRHLRARRRANMDQ